MNSPRYKLLRRSILGLGLFLSLATVGCGGNEFTEASGKVTIDGAPVSAGSVYFVSVANPNLSGGGPLGEDGTFKANVPVGKLKFAVQTRAFKPKAKNDPNPGAKGSGGPPGKGGPPAWAKQGGKKPEAPTPSSEVLAKTGAGGAGGPTVGTTYAAIPEKYEDANTSGLEFEIRSGGNNLGEIKLIGK